MTPFSFAMVSEADFVGKVTGVNNNIFDWLSVFDGTHFPYTKVNGNWSILDEFDVVLLGDANRRLEAGISIARESKCKTVFYPEGTIWSYTSMPFDHQIIFYELLNEVDLIGAVEEDRIPWYESLWDTPAFFLSTPTAEELISGQLRGIGKTNDVLVCCNLGMDHERYMTNLVSGLGVLRGENWSSILCEARKNQLWFYDQKLRIRNMKATSRLTAREYAEKLLAPSRVLLSPSSMIGTSRNAITGAAVGTPVIGNRDSHTQMKLWPKLGVQIHDVAGMKALVHRLIEDDGFYSNVCGYAAEQLPYYSTESATKRFVDAVEGL